MMLIAAMALASYFLWSQRIRFGFDSAPKSAESVSADAYAGQNAGSNPHRQADYPAPGAGTAPRPDEIARFRVPNDAGIPSNGQPVPGAQPIQVLAAPGEIIGYRVDKNGVNQPLRAGDPGIVPNSPGTYAIVDPWAEGGYAVVSGQELAPGISQAELKRLRARERAREAQSK